MDIINNINWVDIVGLILVLIATYLGVRNGLTHELFRFIGTVISIIFAVYWYSQATEIIIMNFSMPAWLSQFLCFLVIIQLTRLIFKYGIVGLLKVMNIQFIPQLERIGGAIIGFGRGVLLYGILLLALNLIPVDYLTTSIYEGSFSGRFMVNAMERTYRLLTSWLPEDEIEKDIFSKSHTTGEKP